MNDGESPSARDPWWRRPAVALLPVLLWQVSVALWPIERLMQVVDNDDAFLYLNVAWNWAHLGRPTFDTVHLTNGFQLPWQLMLTALARAAPDRETLLRLAVALCAALNYGAGLMLFAAARRLAGRAAGWIALAFWASYGLNLHPSLMVMENALHGAAGAALLLAWTRVASEAAPARATLVAFSLALGLNAAVRLDSASISFILWLHILLRALRGPQDTRSILFPLTASAAFIALAYFACNVLIGSSLTPISGAVKLHYAAQYYEGSDFAAIAGDHLYNFRHVLNRSMVTVLGGDKVGWILIGPWGLLVMLGVAAWGATVVARSRPRWRSALGVYGAANLVHLVVMVFVMRHFSEGKWYYTHFTLFFALLFGCLLGAWLDMPLERRPLAMNARRMTATLGAMLALVSIFTFKYYWLEGAKVNIHDIRREVAGQMARMPELEGARLGSWNAGALAYFSGLPIVSLDGLMNDQMFLNRLRNDRPIERYLRIAQIDFLADYNDTDSTMPMAADWERSERFRDLWSWSELEVSREYRMPGEREIYLIRSPQTRGADDPPAAPRPLTSRGARR